MRPTGEEVIEFAREAGFDQVDVRRLAELMEEFEAADAEALAAALIEERRFEQAGAVVVAAQLAGCAVGVSLLDPLTYTIDHVEKMMPVVRAVDGDPVDTLLRLWESGRIHHQSEIAIAYLIGTLRQPPPPQAVSMLRLLCRRTFAPGTMVAIAEVVRLYDDPELSKLAERHLELNKVHSHKRLFERLVSLSPFDLLPERAARNVVSGHTVQRRDQEVGRNDPCPCGSGRKYKKCCLRKIQNSGGTRAKVERKLTDEQFRALSPHEVIALELDTLSPARLVMAFELLVAYSRFEHAGRVLAHMEERGVEDCAEHRALLVERALFVGELDVVRRQVEFMDDEAAAQVEFDLLLGEEGVTVAELAERTLQVLRRQEDDDGPGEVDLAVAMLRRHPPLGILMARAAMSADNPEDAEMLAQVVEEARDKLRLPAGDRASELRDFWAEESIASNLRHLIQRVTTDRQQDAVAEAEELRRKYDRVRRERQELEGQLTQLQGELERVERPVAAPAVEPAQSSVAPPAAEGADVSRLRQKIERLKGIIDEKNEERSTLRDKVSELHERIETTDASEHRQTVELREADAAFEALESAGPDAGHSACLLPRFDDAFESGLGRLPSAVVRRAIEGAAELATAGTANWTGVKRLQSADVYTRRIGRDWRMFFRLEPDAGSLVVLEVVSRQDFERALLRYR